MKKRFMFLTVISLLLISLISMPVQAKSDNDNPASIKGTSYLNIPLKGWTSLEQTETKEAEFVVDKIDLTGLAFHLKGTLEYNGKNIDINKVGTLYKSKQVDGDFVVDFKEDKKSHEGDIALVTTIIRKNIAEEKLVVNKNLKNQDVVKMVFFDPEEKDVILLESPLNKVKGINKVFTNNNKAIETTETDTFAHKIVEPKFETIESEDFSVSSTTESDSHTYWGEGQYDFGYGVARHRMKVKAFASVQYPFSDTKVATGFNVIEEEIYGADGSYEHGSSNLSAGDYSDPVYSYLSTYEKDNYRRDYIYQTEWDMTGYRTSTSSSFSVGLGVNYGPLSGGYSYGKSYSFQIANLQNVYEGGDSYPYYARVDFDNTELRNAGNSYTLNYWVRNGGGSSTATKRIGVHYRVPFYDIWNDKLDTGSSYLNLYYTSY